MKEDETGQRLAALLIQAFNGYSELRFAPILKRYLDIFREELQQAIKSENIPPRQSAKARSEAFGTSLAVLKRQMYVEMSEALADDWLAEYPEHARGESERTTHLWIDELCDATVNDALKILSDYKVVLDDADALWRRSHPQIDHHDLTAICQGPLRRAPRRPCRDRAGARPILVPKRLSPLQSP
jgi:hypothetical protein